MKTLPNFKRGDTFAFIATIRDQIGDPITGVSANLRSQVRDKMGFKYADLSVSETETPGSYLFQVQDTTSWPADTSIYTDIEYTDGQGTITSSETIEIPVVKDVTI